MSKMDDLVSICHHNFENSEEVVSYAESRGLSKDLLSLYKIGFFPQNIDVLKDHLGEEYLLKKCVLKSPYHSDFKDFHKMIIPVINEYNEAVGIVGRSVMTSEDIKNIGIPKYKNSSYKKSSVLFGLNIAHEHILKNDRVYIVEGYLDQIAMYKNGIKNTVAMGGTAFSRGHFLRLLRSTNNLFFIYDRDEAGLANAKRIESKFSDDFTNIQFLRGPQEYKDVDEFFRENSRLDFYKKFKLFVP